jgi:peptidoglycan/xylan/chitin deacetylase (PgdA/CDA1 family)
MAQGGRQIQPSRPPMQTHTSQNERRIVSTLVLFGLATLTGMACALSSPPAEGAENSEGEPEGALSTPLVPIPPGTTVVTLTFADTENTQTRVVPMLARYGMHATFYVNSARIGRSGYLSLPDLRTIAGAGHEIGSHTKDHVDLTTVSLAEARRQICDDRVALMSLGFPVTSFAYPFGSDTPAIRQIVLDCNFNNSRATGGIRHPDGCESCPPAEPIPPVDVFRIRTPPSVQSSWTLADLQSLVLQTEAAGGGWMMISLHELCDGSSCDTYSIREALLDQFLAWLAPRTARGTSVLTTFDVIGGAVKPPIASDGGVIDAGMDAGTDAGTDGGTDAGAGTDAGTDAGVADGGVALALSNASLETDSDGDNVPNCWKRQNLGSNSGGWLRTSTAHTGSWAQRARISSYSSGDRRLVVLQDTGTCAPRATPGRRYLVSAWYETDADAGFIASYRTSSGWVTPWMSGPTLPRSPATYVRGSWVTPPLPAGATHLSVGLALRGVGSLVMDDFTLEQLPAGAFSEDFTSSAWPDLAGPLQPQDAQDDGQGGRHETMALPFD